MYLAVAGPYLQHLRTLIFLEACGISICSMWDLVPPPGIKVRPPALGVWCASHRTSREVPEDLLYIWLSHDSDSLFSVFLPAVIKSPSQADLSFFFLTSFNLSSTPLKLHSIWFTSNGIYFWKISHGPSHPQYNISLFLISLYSGQIVNNMPVTLTYISLSMSI